MYICNFWEMYANNTGFFCTYLRVNPTVEDGSNSIKKKKNKKKKKKEIGCVWLAQD